jgi:hypothetical protein
MTTPSTTLGRTAPSPAVLAAAAAAVAWFLVVRRLPLEPGLTGVVAWAAGAGAVLTGCALILARAVVEHRRVPPARLRRGRQRLFLLGAVVGVGAVIAAERLGAATAADLARVAVGLLLGLAVAEMMERPWWAVLAAAVVAAVDVVSVAAGPSSSIAVADAEPALIALTVGLPAPGMPEAFAVGIADIVFVSCFCAVAIRFGGRPVAGALGMAAGLGASIACAAVFATGLPAMPFIAAGFLATNADRLVPRPRA